MRRLAALGANLNVQELEHGYTALALALVLGHEWVAAELVAMGASVDVPTHNGRTPLFIAAERGYGELLCVMLERLRVDLSLVQDPGRHQGEESESPPRAYLEHPVAYPSRMRAIHVAAFHNQVHVVSRLIAMGADMDAVDEESGFTPLLMAIIGNNVLAALELIRAGANAALPCFNGRTPL